MDLIVFFGKNPSVLFAIILLEKERKNLMLQNIKGNFTFLTLDTMIVMKKKDCSIYLGNSQFESEVFTF